MSSKPDKGRKTANRRCCPICTGDHDPDIACTDLAQEVLRDAGIPIIRPRPSERRFKELVRQAKKPLFVVLAIFITIFLFFVLMLLINEKY